MQDNEHLRCVLIFPDSIGNYINKFPKDEWMVGCGFESVDLIVDKDNIFYGKKMKDFPWIKEAVVIDTNGDISVKEAFRYFKNGYLAIVVTKEGQIDSVIDEESLNRVLCVKKLQVNDSALDGKSSNFLTLPHDADFSAV